MLNHQTNLKLIQQLEDTLKFRPVCVKRQNLYPIQYLTRQIWLILNLSDWLKIQNSVQSNSIEQFDSLSPIDRTQFYRLLANDELYFHFCAKLTDLISYSFQFGNVQDLINLAHNVSMFTIFGSTAYGELVKQTSADRSRYLTVYTKKINHLINRNVLFLESGLLHLAKKSSQMISCPILSQISLNWYCYFCHLLSNSLSQLMTLLYNHPSKLYRVSNEIRALNFWYTPSSISSLVFLKQCIIETKRLFPTKLVIRKQHHNHMKVQLQLQDQMVVLTGHFLRHPNQFNQPNRFMPERWSNLVQADNYLSLMWNLDDFVIRDLIIYLLEIIIINYLQQINFDLTKFRQCDYLNQDNIQLVF